MRLQKIPKKNNLKIREKSLPEFYLFALLQLVHGGGQCVRLGEVAARPVAAKLFFDLWIAIVKSQKNVSPKTLFSNIGLV